MSIEVYKGDPKRGWFDAAVTVPTPARAVTAFAQAWRHDAEHPLHKIVAGYERAMSLSPYSSYDPDAAEEIEEINLNMDDYHDDLSALLADQAAYLSDRDKH